MAFKVKEKCTNLPYLQEKREENGCHIKWNGTGRCWVLEAKFGKGDWTLTLNSIENQVKEWMLAKNAIKGFLNSIFSNYCLKVI